MEKMKPSTRMQLNVFSLGAEELALALGLVGCTDLGKELLSTIHKKPDELYMKALLSSASHSMLARGLVLADGQPVLEKQLQRAMSPLVKFDYSLIFTLVSANQQTKADLRVQKNGDFTARVNKENKVYLLENARSSSLVDYLMDVLDEIALVTELPDPGFTAPIQIDVISHTMEKSTNVASVPGVLEQTGWPSGQARALSEDLSNHLLRGTLIKVIADEVNSPGKKAQAPAPTLLLLRGRQRTWTFAFSSPDLGTIGTATLVDQRTFSRILTDFLK